MTQQEQKQAYKTDEAKRQQEEMILQQRMQEIGFKILVLSGKGGVGKSTVAANLALSLAKKGRSVGLLDVDIHGPSIPKILGLEGSRLSSIGPNIIPIQASAGLQVMSIEFLLSDGRVPVIWRGPLKYKMIRQFLTDVAWGNLDFLVVDSPPGTGDEPMSVAQLVGFPSAAVIVTTPQDIAISDVRRCVTFCQSLSLPVAGILENMSGFLCPKCGEEIDLFKSGGGKALAKEMEVPFLGKVPFDPEIVSAGDAGNPFVDSDKCSMANRSFSEIVQNLISIINKNIRQG